MKYKFISDGSNDSCRRRKLADEITPITVICDYGSNLNLILCDISHRLEEEFRKRLSAELERICVKLDRVCGKSCVFGIESDAGCSAFRLIEFLDDLMIRRFAEKFISEQEIKNKIINSAEPFSRGLMFLSADASDKFNAGKNQKQRKKDDYICLNSKSILMQSLKDDCGLPRRNGYNRRRSRIREVFS